MKKIILWGTGKVANDFVKLLNIEDNEIIAFVDNNKEKVGTCKHCDFGSVKIISPDMTVNLDYDLLIICSTFYYDILLQCEKLHLKNCIPSKDKLKLLNNYQNLFSQQGIINLCLKNLSLIEETNKRTQELLWRDIFIDTVKGYSWYNVKSISLGRWAVGYNYLYVLVRVLDVLKPNEILELGLGQSSKVLTNYFKNNKCTGVYDIVEQDASWSAFFVEENGLDQNLNIIIHNREIKTINYEGYEVATYTDFESVVKDKRYSLISIDGPWGSEGYSRIDLLNSIPNILQEDFVIIIDDYCRDGEKAMVSLLKKTLEENNITYYTGIYDGLKDVCIITSSKFKFLTSL